MTDDRDTPADLGTRIRSVRTQRRMSLRTLSERTNLSVSFLSQLERGLTSASIESMRKIGDALGVLVSDLFASPVLTHGTVLRQEDRPKIEFGDGATKYLLGPRYALTNIEVLDAEIAVGGATGSEPYGHGESEELVIVLRGTVKLELSGAVHLLHAGDSISYRSSVPHRMINAGNEICRVVWVISPPSY